jgi:outer membrane autotransporter protein
MVACYLPAAGVAVAGELGAGQSKTVVPGEAAEAWILRNGASLTLSPLSAALSIAADSSSVLIDAGNVSASASDAIALTGQSAATITRARVDSATGSALSIRIVPSNGAAAMPSNVVVSNSVLSGFTYGVFVAQNHLPGNGTVTLRDSEVRGTGASGVGLVIFLGGASVQGGSVTGQLHGVRIRQDDRGDGVILPSTRLLELDGARVEGVTGSGISIDTLRNQSTNAVVHIGGGSEIVGGGGTAIDLGVRSTADIDVAGGSLVRGDVRVADGSSLALALSERSAMAGATSGDIAMALASQGSWNVSADSSLSSLDLSGGNVVFTPRAGNAHSRVDVGGDLTGSGGVLGLNVTMNAGGPLAGQETDRLFVEGSVTTTGPTEIVVTPRGDGADTDANANGLVDAGEGISLVQVAGTSRADAFSLRGGYVAAGPYQYTLHAFGPGQTDPAQNLLARGTLNWDYRLGSRIVCEGGCGPVEPPVEPPVDPGKPPIDPPVDPGKPPVEPPVDPGEPENPGNPGNPGDGGDGGEPVRPEPPGARVAVVPQVPSYLSAPAALLRYGDMMSDGLHQRLGDIRQGSSAGPLGGEVFARYLGGQLRYSSNLSFERYGYDFDQQVNALQLGGSLIALDSDNGTLRAGWAADRGTTRVTPNAADGNSTAKYRANGVSAWITWQHGDGLWVDGVLGSIRYRGDVGTDMRGADVGRIRANGWTMSVEAGLPIAIGGDWTVEPRFQLKHQQLAFRDFTDTDGLDIRLGTAKQTTAVLGGRISRTAQPRFMPYASVDVSHSSQGDPMATVSSEAANVRGRFGSGKVGNAYKLAAGVVSQVSDRVQLYGEGNYQHFVGGYGMRGWAGNVGLRVSF